MPTWKPSLCRSGFGLEAFPNRTSSSRQAGESIRSTRPFGVSLFRAVESRTSLKVWLTRPVLQAPPLFADRHRRQMTGEPTHDLVDDHFAADLVQGLVEHVGIPLQRLVFR